MRPLVAEPGAVRVESYEEDDGTVVLELALAQEDYGKVIGRGGRTANALRTVVKAAAVRERRRPELIKGSRRARIAKGSGTSVQQVNGLVKQFGQMQKVMKQLGKGRMPDLQSLMRQSR